MEHNPCENCGLCCEHLLVMATSLDVLREPRIDKERPIKKRAVSLPISEASWMLAGPGRPCPFLTTKKQCSIYPTRPNECVIFMPGSSKCQKLRKSHGLSPVVLKPAKSVVSQIIKEVIEEEEFEDNDEDDE